MNRVVLAITGTVAGLVALLSFKTHGADGHGVALPSAELPGSSVPASSATSPSASPSASVHSSASPSASVSAAPSPAATSSAAATVRTATGQAEQTRYGVVQVKVTVTGGKISNVSFVQLTGNDPRSDEINSQAAPILLQETLQAQSANIDGVSGASFTSQGYIASLQSALDQL